MKKHINLADFVAFCVGQQKIQPTKGEWFLVSESRKLVESIAAKHEVYGFNTGIGPFFKEHILPECQTEFQENLLLSHAAGVGEFLNADEARGMMFLLANMLRKGHSGISRETLEQLIALFNRNLVPAIPEHGSVGASGDLAPQAHLALFLIGKGRLLLEHSSVFGHVPNPVRPLRLKPGEAIILINGTHFMVSLLAWAVYRSDILSKTADIAAALTFLTLSGNKESLDSSLHQLRLHPGQSRAARNIKILLGEMDFPPRSLQDAYSLRCTAQIHGPVKETIARARQVVEREINAVTGNPILVENRIIHGGNFHGQILAMTADFLAIALATLANLSERRIERLLNDNLSGLPPFLSRKPGLDSGLMIAQYTAADLCSENKVLSHPASVDSISLAAGQEDFVSMGAGAVRKARKVCFNAVRVIAIELLCGLRALELREFPGDFAMQAPIIKIAGAVRKQFNFDRQAPLSKAIDEMYDLVKNSIVLAEAEKIVGPLT